MTDHHVDVGFDKEGMGQVFGREVRHPFIERESVTGFLRLDLLDEAGVPEGPKSVDLLGRNALDHVCGREIHSVPDAVDHEDIVDHAPYPRLASVAPRVGAGAKDMSMTRRGPEGERLASPSGHLTRWGLSCSARPRSGSC